MLTRVLIDGILVFLELPWSDELSSKHPLMRRFILFVTTSGINFTVAVSLDETPLLRWGGLSTKKFHPNASTSRAQLSVAFKTIMSTDLFNPNVKIWVNTD